MTLPRVMTRARQCSRCAVLLRDRRGEGLRRQTGGVIDHHSRRQCLGGAALVEDTEGDHCSDCEHSNHNYCEEPGAKSPHTSH